MPTQLADLPYSTNLRLWYDADDTASITESSGAVSQWNDKSGNADHATQGTAARQPTLVGDQINFDGGDILIIPGTSIFRVTGGNYPKTIFALMSATADGMVIGHGSSSAGFQDTYQVGLNIRNSHVRLSAVNNGSGVQFEGTSDMSTERLICIQIAASDNEIFTQETTGGLISSEGTSGNSPQSFGYSRATIGATDGSASNAIRDGFTGSIKEILVYEELMSDSNREAIFDYLFRKWFENALTHQVSLTPVVDTDSFFSHGFGIPTASGVNAGSVLWPVTLRHDNLGLRSESFLKGKGDI